MSEPSWIAEKPRGAEPSESGDLGGAVQVERLLYVAQLGQGVGSLRFAPSIEAEFRDDNFERSLSRLRVGLGVAIGLYLLFLSIRLLTESGPAANWGLGLRVIIIVSMMLTALASYRVSRKTLTPLVVLTYLIFGAGVTAIECVAQHFGIDRRYEGLIFICIHCFVFSGLLFRTALLTTIGIFLIYMYGGWLGGLSGKTWGYELFFLALMIVMGSVAQYLFESADRENFLRRHILREITQHGALTGMLGGSALAPQNDRLVATILFTDLANSTAQAAQMGDKAWRGLLARQEEATRRELKRFGGREIGTAGDGFLAIFDRPAQAIYCAESIVKEVKTLGLHLRAGLHSGEIELERDTVRGIAVHIASRVSGIALADQVLVSRTVRDLVGGSGIQFIERGMHEFKGVPEPWQVYEVSSD